MNIDQAKQIPLSDVLQRLGHSPTHIREHELWYRSPLRTERTPSFKINNRNQWYDFGTGEHGDTIDLIEKLFKLSSVSEALAELERIVAHPMPPSSSPAASPAPSNQTPAPSEITSARPLRSRALRGYLSKRGIDRAVADSHLVQVHYKRGDRSYFALGFANDAGGYELRTQGFKGTIGNKTLTTLEGCQDRVAVFEGFMDYLTALTRATDLSGQTVIVMNSAAMKARVIESLEQMKPTHVDLWLDNDDAGRTLSSEIQRALPGVSFHDHSVEYSNFNDLNEWHMASRSKNK